uniref:Paxillin n=1 Tax=Glossina pallidipes TaxID=7398 RepID=A0A1B0AH52_GLOPL
MSSKLLSTSFHSQMNDSFKVGDFERRLDALLADLQNSVPGHPQPHYNTHVATVQQQRQVPLATTSQYHNNYVESSGYGSLRGKGANTAQPVYQEHYSETLTSVSPSGHGSYNGVSTNSVSPASHFHNQGAIPRQPYNGSSGPLNTASNLSELDSLLEDLSSARYNGASYERKEPGPSGFHTQPTSKYNTYNSYASVEERPSVDSLLNEMDNASLYAVPNGVRGKSPTPGRRVTITVRETKTENVNAPECKYNMIAITLILY